MELWFQADWPPASWRVLPRAQLLEKANQAALHFGVNTTGWEPVPSSKVSKSLARYARQHPQDSSAHSVSPLSLRIKLRDKRAHQRAEVGFDSAGHAIYWHAPEDFKPKQTFPSQEAAATDAFRFLAGTDAATYGTPIRSAGDESNEEEYLWKKPPPAHSEVRDRIKVVVKDSVVQSADHRVLVTYDDDDDSDSGGDENYWNVLEPIFVLISTAASVAIFAIYILWLARKSVSHQFPLRMGGLAFVLVAAAANSRQNTDAAKIVFITVIVIAFAAVGRGISLPARPKWVSLEQMLFLAPLSKSAGRSIAGGLLCSPLLVAIPFLIVGCGLFAGASVVPRNVELLYSRAPVFESIDGATYAYLLGFFGFVVPVFRRVFRRRWVAWLLLLPVGTLLFADHWQAVAGPLAAPVTAGFLTLLLFAFVYACFDVLGVLTLQLASSFVLSALILSQKSAPCISLVAALGVLAIVAYWFSRRGATVSEGDPRATNPAITGFRAEREKLRAEFSVARRAQQDMLPQTPPNIPGYSIAASCTPSLDVGGDLYDFLKLPDGRIGFGVADVSGKGVPAALYMTLTKGLLSAVTKDHSKLSRVVEEVNRHLHSVTRKKVFVTMALGFLDAEKRLLQCVRAGHNPMVWRQTNRDLTTLVAPGGLGLGITASRIFSTQLQVEEMALSEGDAVVFYSDGITEAMNSGLEQFGEQRLMDAVNRTDTMDAAATRDSILTEVRAFLDGVHPQDDMTLVVLRVGEHH